MMRRAPAHGVPVSHGPPLPGPGQISNVTNSKDFLSKDSRVFVGNLNTFAISKEDVDGIFRRYGMVTGISMHKGYAFVQFNFPGEARRAVSFENGQMYAGQSLDLNIVSEPKGRSNPTRGPGPGMNNSRRPPVQSSPVMPPAAKRPRQDSNPSLQRSNLVTLANSSSRTIGTVRPNKPIRPAPYSAASKVAAAAVKRATATVTKSATNASRASSSSSSATSVAPTTDVLICGVCKMQFTSLHSLAQHKKIPCRLRTSCQCQTNPPKLPDINEPLELSCATCEAQFDSAWALCQHCQTEHSISIFKSKDEVSKTNNAPSASKASNQGEASEEDKNGKEIEGGTVKQETKSTTPVKN